jgi:ATP-dependent protease ClpP protease subunit
MVYTIPVYGLIGSPESPDDKAKYFTYNDLLLHINKAQGYDIIELDIASDGGYCDVEDKMEKILIATGKQIISKNSGNICSAASRLFTLAPKGSRLYDPSKGIFLIHNPWGEVEGDSSDLATASKELQSIENDYAKWYSEKTGADINVIKGFMKENIPLTPEQIESLGFATIVKPVINAVAKLKSNYNQMENNKEITEKLNVFEKTLNKILASFKPKSLMIADADGKELEFPEITTPEEITVGVKILENGTPANGEFLQTDGTTIVADNGAVTEVKPKADETQALKDENEALKAELEALKAEKAGTEKDVSAAVASFEKLSKEFKSFKAEFSKEDPADGTPPSDITKSKLPSKEELEKML